MSSISSDLYEEILKPNKSHAKVNIKNVMLTITQKHGFVNITSFILTFEISVDIISTHESHTNRIIKIVPCKAALT